MKISEFNLNKKNALTIFLTVALVSFVFLGCKRNSPCDNSEKNVYYSIPPSTKPFIINKKGEILVFANSKGDTAKFVCVLDSHYNKLVNTGFTGNADCPRQYFYYSETYEYKYKGETAYFGFMDVKYGVNSNAIPDLLTDYLLNVSDSIFEKDIFEGFLIRTPTDSILFSGKYYLGTYSVDRRILFNKDLGLIKFKDNKSTSWQLIQKK